MRINGISLIPLTSEFLNRIRRLFIAYTNQFNDTDPVYREHIEMKIVHTSRVCTEIDKIACSLGCNPFERNFIELLGLLHDIGRFKQWHMYQTFNDAVTVNHAQLSVEIIEEENILHLLPSHQSQLVKQVILLHNLPLIPDDEPPLVKWYARMLRDADKIDIWQLNIQHNLGHSIVQQKLPEVYQPSESLMRCFRSHRIITIDMADSFYDILLFRLSWIFNLSFRYSYFRVQEMCIVNIFLDKLPAFDYKDELRTILNEFIYFQLSAESSLPGSFDMSDEH